MSDLTRIESKIDKLDDRLGAIDVTLGSQHEVLKFHIRRTTQLEEALKPVVMHVNFMKSGTKWAGGIILISCLLKAVISIFSALHI